MADHEHPDFLQHHFETPVQQYDATKLGMWLFLATEILLFGGLFVAYAVYRANHPEIFVYAHQFLDKNRGALNTIVSPMPAGQGCGVTSPRKSIRGKRASWNARSRMFS